MIAWIEGTILKKSPLETVINVRGVGYRLFIPLSTFEVLPPVGEAASLHVHTAVREDALDLYGFAKEDEREMFLKLISVSRVGPRLAIQALSGSSPDVIHGMISRQDITGLSRIKGVGKKTAERIVVELKDKMEPVSITAGGSVSSPVQSEAIEALTGLGYKRAEAEKGVAAVIKSTPDASLEQTIRLALQELSK